MVTNDVSRGELADLKAAGVLGITFNAALLGVDYYADTASLLAELAALSMFVDIQVQRDQLVSIRFSNGPTSGSLSIIAGARRPRPASTSPVSGRCCAWPKPAE